MHGSKNNISIVIISLNEEHQIEQCIASCRAISDNIILIDSESEDQTVDIARKSGAEVSIESWQGYGFAKNLGASKARHDWILSIDADERPDSEMVRYLNNIDLKKNTIYRFRRLNHVANMPVHYGEWNPDVKSRLYHRDVTQWNNASVHETLEIEKWHKLVTLPGHLLHYSYRNLDELEKRLDQYAQLSAREMADAKLKPGFTSKFKPWFRFFKSYYLKGGFKDKQLGYHIAKYNADAIRKKYDYLKKLLNN